MVRRLIAAEHDVLVYARNAEIRERAAGYGALLAESAIELAESSQVMISCLFSDAQLREAGMGSHGFARHLRENAVFVSHTTGAIESLSALAAAAGEAISIVDAPVSGTSADVEAGTMTVLLGGEDHVVETVRRIVGAYACNIVHTGGFGSALAVKSINNALFTANAQLVAAALELASNLGLPSAPVLEAILACSGTSGAARAIAGFEDLRGFERAVSPVLTKDVGCALDLAGRAGVDADYLATVIRTGPLTL